MDLQVVWFVVVAFFWTGFFVLEGFDFGVGALHRVVGKDDVERRVAINSIGPLWDGNEVWLVTAGAAMFAAFPAWYATWFSALYLMLVVVLVALIIRGVSFEFRGKSESMRWRGSWSTTLTIGSVLAPLLFGIGLGDLLSGLPIDGTGSFTGGFWSLLTPYGLVFGVTLLALTLLHGATFLALKTDGAVQSRAYGHASMFRWIALVLVLAVGAWTVSLSARSALTFLFVGLAIVGAVGAAAMIGRRRDGWAFVMTAVTIGSTVAALFASLYPDVMVSSTSAANNLTIASTGASSYALTVMTWVAVILVPVVVIYQGWTAYVFRARVSTPISVTGSESPTATV